MIMVLASICAYWPAESDLAGMPLAGKILAPDGERDSATTMADSNRRGKVMTRSAILTLMTCAIFSASASAQGWAEKMIKEGLTYDFGNVARGAQLTHSFTITNIYAVRMEITSIKSGCGCVTAEAKKRILEPRESTELLVRVDTKRFTGPKTVGVRVTVGPEYISSAEIKVTANSRADIVFNPGQFSFGTVTQGETPTQSVDVEYAGVLNWQILEVLTKDIPYSVSHKELYRRPGQVGYRITATLKADAPLGSHKHSLFLKTNDPSSPSVPILLESTIQSSVSVTPSSLSLGTIKMDAPLLRRVMVRAGKPFRITAIEGTGAGFELGSPLAERDEPIQFVTIKCQPTTEGAFRRELKIKTTLQEAPLIVTIDGMAGK